MKIDKTNELLIKYLEDFQERVQQPKLKRLKYLVKSRKKRPDLKQQLTGLGLKKNVCEKILKEDVAKDKRIKKLLQEQQQSDIPNYIRSTKNYCKRFREELSLRGNTFEGKPVIEFKPFFRHMLSTSNPKTLKNLPKVEQLLSSRKNRQLAKDMGWADEGPFQARIEAQNTYFLGDEGETYLYSGYHFIPTQHSYRYFIKWDGMGWYAALAEPRYGLTGEVKLKIKFTTYFIQSPYPGVITVERRPWTILDIDSTNIAESNFLGGYEHWDTDVTFMPGEPVLITQEMHLYAYSLNYGFGIINFEGIDDRDFWINFGIFGIPN